MLYTTDPSTGRVGERHAGQQTAQQHARPRLPVITMGRGSPGDYTDKFAAAIDTCHVCPCLLWSRVMSHVWCFVSLSIQMFISLCVSPVVTGRRTISGHISACCDTVALVVVVVVNLIL